MLASEDAAAFARWTAFESVNVPPRIPVTKGAHGAFAAEGTDASAILNTECPYHCGVCENHLMTACCVLLNVTDRCNQRCPYCFASAGKEDGSDPPLSVIDGWLDRLIELGEERKFNIQLNGGEPTVRDDLSEIVRLCRDKGFEYIQLNTNGRRLAESEAYAKELADAGLTTVFLQFDGVDDEVYDKLRGEPLLEIKRRAIEHCGKTRLPVTLVPTVTKSANLAQVGAIIDFMLDHIHTVKGVHFQPASFFGRKPGEANADGDFDERVTMFALMEEIERQTGGRIQTAALAPISTGHPLCCFCGTFLKQPGGSVAPLHPKAEPQPCCEDLTRCAERIDGRSHAKIPEISDFAESTAGEPCGCEPDPLEIIRKDRDFVLNKWQRAEDKPQEELSSSCSCADTPLSFDEAIAQFRNNLFTVSGMAFMDQTNLDAERLRRCRVQVFTKDERLVPFCGYYSLEGSGLSL